MGLVLLDPPAPSELIDADDMGDGTGTKGGQAPEETPSDNENDAGDTCPNDATRSAAHACGCDVEIPPSPAHHWALNEASGATAQDSASLGRHGALSNGPVWSSEGHVDGALSFDGSDDYVEVGELGAQMRSLAFWIKPSSFSVETTETDWLSPSTWGPNNDWNNPKNALAADGDNASASSLLGGTSRQHWGGFGITIPTGASIVGISVGITTSSLSLLGNLSAALSWNQGQAHTTSKSEFSVLGLGGVSATVGGPTDTWGRTWTASELSDAAFRARASYSSIAGTMLLDHIQVKVHYSPTAHGRQVFNLNGVTQVAFSGTTPDELLLENWPGAAVYVNGEPGSTLSNDWNFVVITGPTAQALSTFQMGRGAGGAFAFPFHGMLDDVKVFEQELTAEQVAALYESPDCAQD